jgi:hypothetical protein
MPATWARTEYMMNNDTNVPVNRPEKTGISEIRIHMD